jgi:hypothetical protein
MEVMFILHGQLQLQLEQTAVTTQAAVALVVSVHLTQRKRRVDLAAEVTVVQAAVALEVIQMVLQILVAAVALVVRTQTLMAHQAVQEF